ncbi:MAG: hypothetical protein L6416_03715 [Candidatus Omnitrophica bacterium]|nr:hypothetical protein [Candidatus Omnitrophota bacterium]
MKSKILIITILLYLCQATLFFNTACAQTNDRKKTDLNIDQFVAKTYRPEITLQEALKIAEKFIKDNTIDVSEYYLNDVKMIKYGGKENSWFFIWINEKIPASLGDEIHIIVTMDGVAKRLPTL